MVLGRQSILFPAHPFEEIWSQRCDQGFLVVRATTTCSKDLLLPLQDGRETIIVDPFTWRLGGEFRFTSESGLADIIRDIILLTSSR